MWLLFCAVAFTVTAVLVSWRRWNSAWPRLSSRLQDFGSLPMSPWWWLSWWWWRRKRRLCTHCCRQKANFWKRRKREKKILPVLILFGPSCLGASGETAASLWSTSWTLDLSIQEPRRIVAHSLTRSLCQPYFFFLFLWLVGGGGVGHLGWTKYCCARHDSVALCVHLLPQALIFPKQLYEAIFEEELTTIKIFVRLYGATLLSKLEKETTCHSVSALHWIYWRRNAAWCKPTFACAALTSQLTFLTSSAANSLCGAPMTQV